jgi:DNA-directed RNA polymerase subunit omega
VNKIPLDTLIDYKGNMYELTCVAIKEANILANPGCGGREIEEENGKIVSEVLSRALNGDIAYTKDEEAKDDPTL